MKEVLIIFWHGIGDVVMATPAFRAFRKQNPDVKLAIGLQEVAFNSGILRHCSYFDEIIKIDNPWSYRNFDDGIKKIKEQIKKYKNNKIIWINLKDDSRHKALVIASELGVDINSDHKYELFISKQEEEEALAWIKENNLKNYIFLHYNSSDSRKNISQRKFKKFLPLNMPIIIPGESYDIKNRGVNFSAIILRQARFSALVDSVFLHASDALNKNIDILLAIPETLKIVYPLHIKYNKLIAKKVRKWDAIRYRLKRFYEIRRQS